MKTTITADTIFTRIRQTITAAILGIFVLEFAPSILAQAISSQTASLGYSRDLLQNEQRIASAYLDRANSELESAQQRLSDDLPALAERGLILGFLNVDAAKAKMAGEEQRIAALQPGLFFHSHQNHLRAVCADLRARSQRIEDSLYQLEESQPAGITNGWKALAIYLGKRNDFARQFQNRTLSPDDLISDVQLLQQYPLPLVLAGLINFNNYHAWTKLSGGVWRPPTGVDFLADGSLKPAHTTQAVPVPKPPTDSSTAAALKQLELRTSQLDQTVSRLRTEQSNMFSGLSSRLEQASKTNTNATAPVQNVSLTSKSTRPEATSASSTANRATQQATQPVPSVTVESPKRAAEVVPAVAAPVKTHQATVSETPLRLVAKTNSAIVAATLASRNTASDERKAETNSEPRQNIALFAGIGGGGIVLCAIIWLGYISFLRGRPHVLSLACGSGKTEEFELAAMDEALCLQAPPVREAAALVNGAPNIIIGWRGPVLRPGTHSSVHVNDVLVSGQKKLFPGDCILIAGETSQQFNFLGCDRVSAGLTADA